MQKLEMLQILAEKVSKCTKCDELVCNRIQTVFGEGSPDAKILFCGEASGKEEDIQGKPFVGQSGKLLNNILKECGIKREDVYICNILKCRPPGNRTPTQKEADACRSFLDLQIKIVNPSHIVCLGNCAAQNLLRTNEKISYLRGKIYDYLGRKVICTFHPSFLLHNPDRKRDVWEDMQLLISCFSTN